MRAEEMSQLPGADVSQTVQFHFPALKLHGTKSFKQCVVSRTVRACTAVKERDKII